MPGSLPDDVGMVPVAVRGQLSKISNELVESK